MNNLSAIENIYLCYVLCQVLTYPVVWLIEKQLFSASLKMYRYKYCSHILIYVINITDIMTARKKLYLISYAYTCTQTSYT